MDNALPPQEDRATATGNMYVQKIWWNLEMCVFDIRRADRQTKKRTGTQTRWLQYFAPSPAAKSKRVASLRLMFFLYLLTAIKSNGRRCRFAGTDSGFRKGFRLSVWRPKVPQKLAICKLHYSDVPVRWKKFNIVLWKLQLEGARRVRPGHYCLVMSRRLWVDGTRVKYGSHF